MATPTPVLIVGAGPAGLVLALSLLKNGVTVRIIDKAPEFHVGSRGAGMMPRTQEIMNLLETLSDIERYAAPIPQMRSYKLPGGTQPLKTWDLMAPLEPSPSCPYLSVIELGQDVSEGILRSHLHKFGCVVELGTELVGLAQDGDGVTAHLTRRTGQGPQHQTVRVQYLVGADGARGVVRKMINLSFVGETRDSDELVVGDVEVTNLSTDFWHFWGDAPKSTTAISLRPSGPGRKQFGIFMVGKDLGQHRLTQAENFREFFQQFTGRTDIILGKFRWLSYFKPHMRMVDEFSKGRVFLVGDAAHVHSPTGGQGMNSSVQDSFNLGWKMALTVNGYASESLLSSYTEERLPVISEMLRQTSNLHTKTFSGSELGAESSGWSRGKLLYMLDINYRWSPIVVDERRPHGGNDDELRSRAYGGHGEQGRTLCAGDRAPEAPGLVSPGGHVLTSVFDMLTATYHTLLLFPNNDHSHVDRVLRSVGKYPQGLIRTVLILKRPWNKSYATDFTFLDRDGHAHNAYASDRVVPTIAIVRPDGVVGAIVQNEEGVERYFSKILISS